MNTYKPGQWKMICDVCGFEHYNEEMQKRWDGVWVCKADFETRHPQEFGRTVFDKQSVPYSRPELPEVYISVPYINNPTVNAVPGELDGSEPALPD